MGACRNLIEIELAYLNTSHPDFVGDAARVPAAHVKQMRSVVAVGLADSYVPAGHVVTALHCRSDFCVGGMLS